jgi:uncharacterized membrane protein
MIEALPVDTDVAEPVAAGGIRRHAIALGVLTTAAAVLYGACGFLQFHLFRAGSYDLVIFDQAVRSYSEFHLPIAVVKGVHNGFGTGFSVLGDHFSPILATLAPLYWIHSGPQTLIVAQALLFAAAIVPLWVFARRELGAVAAYCVAVGYAVSWPVAQAVTFDFHEVAFVPLLTAVLFERCSAYRRDRGRWWHVVLPAVGLLLVKEDMGLLVAGFGLAMLVVSVKWITPRRTRVRWLGAGFVAGGLAAVVVCTDVWLPAFGGRAGYYWHYGRFGPTLPSAAWDALTHPGTVATTLVQPEVKIHTIVWLLVIAAFAPLLSPFLLVVLPPLAERMLSDDPNWWGTDFHYNAFLVVAVLCAGVDGIARVRRWWPKVKPVGVTWGASVLVIGLWIVPGFAFGAVAQPSSWHRTAALNAAAEAVAHVPAGVTVEAANNVGPQLTGRATVVLWDNLPRWAPWVLADTNGLQFPFCGVPDQQARVAFLLAHGYRVTFADDGFQVLHHPGPLPPLNTAPSPGCPG